MSNCKAETRKDDGRVVISTDAYVSHRKGRPWRSSFSLTREDAATLRDELNQLLGDE